MYRKNEQGERAYIISSVGKRPVIHRYPNYMPKVKQRDITPRWYVDKDLWLTEKKSLLMHDCPYDDSPMWAVETNCQSCGTEASDFLKLAVKMKTVETVDTLMGD